MMDIDEEQNNNFVIEEDQVQYGTEIANPPLVVVVQGGKNVILNIILVRKIDFN